MRIYRVSGLFLAVFTFCLCLSAQNVSNNNNGGAPQNAAFRGSDLDTIQVNNGNLMIRIPLWELPGRSISSGQSFVYNSKGFHMTQFCGTTCNYNVKPMDVNQMGWTLTSASQSVTGRSST